MEKKTGFTPDVKWHRVGPSRLHRNLPFAGRDQVRRATRQETQDLTKGGGASRAFCACFVNRTPQGLLTWNGISCVACLCEIDKGNTGVVHTRCVKRCVPVNTCGTAWFTLHQCSSCFASLLGIAGVKNVRCVVHCCDAPSVSQVLLPSGYQTS